MTGSTPDYLASMKADYNAFAPSILHLKNILSNSALINAAASVYSGAFPRPWQTIFGDMNWDVITEPVRHSSLNNKLIPGQYLGTAGFIQMVNEVLNLISLLEQSYGKQETFLNQIDAEIKQKGLFLGTFKKQPLPIKKITDYLIFNQYENKRIINTINVLNHLNLDRTKLFKTLKEQPRTGAVQKIVLDLTEPNINNIKSHVTENVFSSAHLNDLIASLKSHLIEDAVYLDKLFYLLIIVEEAVSKAQATNAEPGDLVAY